MADNQDRHDHDDDDEHPRDPETGERSCGAPLEAHFEALIINLVQMGVGFDCREVYHALVEVADSYRRVGGFLPYTAQDGGPAAQFEIGFNRASKQARQEAANAPEARLAYAQLSSDDKKRFN